MPRAKGETSTDSPFLSDADTPSTPKSTTTEPETGKKKRRSLLGGDTPRKKSNVKLDEGMTSLLTYLGAVIPDPGVGAAIRMTAPTSGRLLAEGVKRFPNLHSFLAIFLGAGTGARDFVACFEIPRLIGTMERRPDQIPSLLPMVRAHMRPILRDMLKAAREEKKIRDEIATLEQELGNASGEERWSVDRLILVDMLGLDVDRADRIIAGEPIESIFSIPEEEE